MDPSQNPNIVHATTIISVRRGGHVAVAGDGQVTWPYGHEGQCAQGAPARARGSGAGRFRRRCRRCVYLVRVVRSQARQTRPVDSRRGGAGQDWRTERRLGKLEALLAVADKETSLIISGTGDVIEPEDGIIAIGSGGAYALSAARALLAHTELDAKTIATEAINIAGDICIYTNRNVVVEEL